MAKNSGSLTGSQMDGPDQDLADWAGIEIPTEKRDAYYDLVGGMAQLEEFLWPIKNGWFEVTGAYEDLGPGLNDTYWAIHFDDADALRAEIRALLIKELEISNPVTFSPKQPLTPEQRGEAIMKIASIVMPVPKRKTRGRVSRPKK